VGFFVAVSVGVALALTGSEAYQEARKLRDGAARMRAVAVQGID